MGYPGHHPFSIGIFPKINHTSNLRWASNPRRGIDLKKIASQMNGASGAESKAVCTEARAPLRASTGLRGMVWPKWRDHETTMMELNSPGLYDYVTI